jgi:hypothetical protein
MCHPGLSPRPGFRIAPIGFNIPVPRENIPPHRQQGDIRHAAQEIFQMLLDAHSPGRFAAFAGFSLFYFIPTFCLRPPWGVHRMAFSGRQQDTDAVSMATAKQLKPVSGKAGRSAFNPLITSALPFQPAPPVTSDIIGVVAVLGLWYGMLYLMRLWLAD